MENMVNSFVKHFLLNCQFFTYIGYPGIYHRLLQRPWKMLLYVYPLLGSALCSGLSQEIPLARASLFSMLTYSWVSPLMVHNRILQIRLQLK